MKKLSVLLLLAIGMGLILFHSCQKEQSVKTRSEVQNISDDDAMVRQIIAFKEKCEFLLDNPDFKTGGSMAVDSAVYYISATLNYMYAFNVKISQTLLDTSLIAIQANRDGTISLEVVASVLEEVTDSVREHYQNVPYQNKKLIAICLDYYIDHENYILKVISVSGNTVIVPQYTNEDFWHGKFEGSCDNTIFLTDAAEEIQTEIDGFYRENPPPNCQFYWPDPKTIEHVITPFNNYLYENPNDPEPVNYEDYTIFYMDGDVDNYEYPHCLEANDELLFYKSGESAQIDHLIPLQNDHQKWGDF